MDRGAKAIGNCIYIPMQNGKRAKCYLDDCGVYRHYDGICCEIIDKESGKIDRCVFPFTNYFDKVKCSPGAPEWTPYIDGNKWYFEQYTHCLPSGFDFKRITDAICEYVDLFN